MEQLSTILGNVLVVESNGAPDEVLNQTELIEPEAKPDKQPAKIENVENKVKDKQEEAVDSPISPFWYLEDGTKRAGHQFSDRIMEKLLSVMIADETQALLKIPPVRVRMLKKRPPFSVNTMNTNSTQLAQKGSPLFEYFDAVFLCFTWDNPYYTLGILLLITHAILRPELFVVFPPALILLKYMFPSYLKLYPYDDTFVDGKFFERNPIPHPGKPLGKYKPPKAASMYSKEYLMNFTDMQNHIVPYIRLHDFLLEWGKHYVLFEDQEMSTLVFLILTFLIAFIVFFFPMIASLTLRVIPLQAFAIVFVWTFFIISHPSVGSKLLESYDTEEARIARLDKTDKAEKYLLSFINHEPEEDLYCEVEIFELQRYSRSSNLWKPLGFTHDYYSLNHPDRILGSDDSGDTLIDSLSEESIYDPDILFTSALSNVKPPNGWTFTDKKWKIDFNPNRWVDENCIMDLVSVDNEEKWVYDAMIDDDEHQGLAFRRRRWYRYSQRDGIDNNGRRGLTSAAGSA